MTREVLRFLREVAEADGVVDEREEMGIDHIARIFDEKRSMQLGRGN